MGANISNIKREPSLILQFYGKTNSSTNIVGGKSKDDTIDKIIQRPIITKRHTDFNEDFVAETNGDDEADITYKWSQINGRISYVDAKKYEKKLDINLHLGQFKLFFTELLFLTKYIKDVSKVLYVGAAAGYHIPKLADLFPNVLFDLWDPGKFKLEPRKNIKIYNLAFNNETAKTYASHQEKMLFMCDIRTLDVARLMAESRDNEVDELVEDDMLMQAEWIKIINPVYAYLKFRLPWYSKRSKYLGGTIYLQPYSPVSTETRLMTNNYTDYIEYDNTEYDEKMAYFNFKTRIEYKYQRWNHILEKYKLLDCWDNALSLYIVDYYLRKIHNTYNDDAVGKLYMEIFDFHYNQFGKKYDVLLKK